MFDDRLRKLREQKAWTQKRAAEILGINQRTYSSYENNEREPNSEMLILLSDFFDVTIDYLLGKADNPTATYAPAPNEKNCDICTDTDKDTIKLYMELDTEDKAEIRGEIKGMLKSDKYTKEHRKALSKSDDAEFSA